MAERGEIAVGQYVDKDAVYGSWTDRAKERGNEPGNVSQFSQKLMNAFPEIATGRRGPRGQQFTTYEGNEALQLMPVCSPLQGWLQPGCSPPSDCNGSKYN